MRGFSVKDINEFILNIMSMKANIEQKMINLNTIYVHNGIGNKPKINFTNDDGERNVI